VLRTINEAYKIAALNAAPISAFEALYLATLGGARSLGLEDASARLRPAARQISWCLSLRPRRCSPSARTVRAPLEETLFVLMTLGDDRAVRATYVAGALAHARDPVDA
jgi:guanine deaminase